MIPKTVEETTEGGLPIRDLFAFAGVRAIIGDPHGKLMQDEVADRIHKLVNVLRETVGIMDAFRMIKDDCPTPTWRRGKNRCLKRDAKEPRKIGLLARLVLGSWHSAWACYHLERVGDPVTFTCSDGSCRHDNRYKHHRRALNKLSENAIGHAPGEKGNANE